MRSIQMAAIATALHLLFATVAFTQDPLPSWHDTSTKSAIVKFVQQVSSKDSPDFVPASERIVTLDNDGTLWAEKPAYFQLLFAIDRVKALASEHPQWKNEQPFKAVLENDMKALVATGKPGLLKVVAATHAGMTTEEFAETVRDWIASAEHPQKKVRYTELVYQPMLELMEYLRANGFKTYIVSGGGIEFMRVFAEEVYGIPPDQVIGSSIEVKYEEREGKPVLMRLPKIDFIDDEAGKPVGIHRFIGRRPLAAVGNSDGDLQMLKWTAAGQGPRFCLLVHHTDSQREWAYDRDSSIGKLDKALTEAGQQGWTVIDMKRDWKQVFPSQ